jgi:hypothetical protein
MCKNASVTKSKLGVYEIIKEYLPVSFLVRERKTGSGRLKSYESKNLKEKKGLGCYTQYNYAALDFDLNVYSTIDY